MAREEPSTALSVPLRMDVSQVATGQVVTVCGRIDARSLAPLRDLLHRVIDAGSGDVMLMLGEAEIGDPAALGVLVGAHHRARRAGRRLVVSQASARTTRLLRACRLHRVLGGTGRLDAEPVAPLTAYLPT